MLFTPRQPKSATSPSPRLDPAAVRCDALALDGGITDALLVVGVKLDQHA